MSASIWSPLENAADYVKKIVLAAFDGASLIGYYELQGELYFRTLLAKLRDRWASVKGYGAVGDGITDDSLAIQRAIDANYGKMLSLPPGFYKVTIAPKILQRIVLDFSKNQAVLLLATPNMNGIEIGDGTDVTRNKLFGTKIYNPSFQPFSGVTASTGGAAVYRNYVAYVDVYNPSIYGLDAGVKKLFHGVKDIRATECDTPYILAQQLAGSGVYAEGLPGTANRTVDCNYDFARILSCDGDGMYWGADTAGIGCYKYIGYDNLSGWAIRINSTAGPNGQNYFITDIDVEGANAASGGGVYVQSGQRVTIKGGWIGTPSEGGALGIGVRIGAAADSCVIDTNVSFGRVLLEGQANTIIGGEYSGDTVTAGVGILISGDDNKISSGVRVRQFPGTGIGFSGTPARVNIGDVAFKNNGTDIAPITGFASLAGPKIAACTTDKARSIAAASSITVSVGINFVQLTGAGTVNTINTHGVGSRLTIQASSSGNTIGTGGNVVSSSGAVVVAAFNTVSLVCDGNNWFIDGQS